MGATATIFAVVEGVMLAPLPYPASERLAWLTVSVSLFPGARLGVAPGMLSEMQGMPDVVDAAAVYSESTQRMTVTTDGEPERVGVLQASRGFFEVLGVFPMVGRGFAASDVAPGSADEAVVVLSHAFWTRRYGADRGIIGRSIVLDGRSYDVIGVMPRGFAFPSAEVEAWMPAALGDRYGGYAWRGIARLRPGVSLEDAEARLDGMVPHLAQAFPESRIARAAVDRDTRLHVQRLKDVIVFETVRHVLWIMFGAMAFVFLMACANVLNLFLARAEGRRRDVAVRSALGAEPGRIVRHFVAEGVALASVGGLLGLGLTVVGVRVVRHLGPIGLPRLAEIRVDASVVAYAALASVCAGGLCGLAGLGSTRGQGLGALAARGAGGRPGSARLRRSLVVSQIAFALILLIGSGLMMRSFRHLVHVDPGFDPNDVLTFDVRLDSGYRSQEEGVAFQAALTDRLRALPGVLSVAASTCIPLRDRCPGGANVRDRDVVVLQDPPPVVPTGRALASPGYFETMGVPLLRGRSFGPGPDDSLSVIVSASLAKDRWPGSDPVGRAVALGDWSSPAPPRWYTVIGVVGDLPAGMRLTTPNSVVTRVLYYPTSAADHYPTNANDAGAAEMTFVVRAATPPLGLVNAVRRAVASMDSDLPVDRVEAMREYVETARAPMAFLTTLLVVCGTAALLLAMVGIHGVVAYTVGRRTKEIGVRVALGATAWEVIGMVVTEGAWVAATGAAIGLAGALALTRLMDVIVFGVSATDPATWLAASVGLMALAVIFTWLPARRAAKVDPVVALRSD